MFGHVSFGERPKAQERAFHMPIAAAGLCLQISPEYRKAKTEQKPRTPEPFLAPCRRGSDIDAFRVVVEIPHKRDTAAFVEGRLVELLQLKAQGG